MKAKLAEIIEGYTVLDLVVLIYSLVQIGVLFIFPVLSVPQREFTRCVWDKPLALHTVLASTVWFPPLMGALSLWMFWLQRHRSFAMPLKRKRAILFATFAFSGIALSVCTVGVFTPVMQYQPDPAAIRLMESIKSGPDLKP